ncbi:MAG: acyl carrier protein [Planctomycetia bacterium]
MDVSSRTPGGFPFRCPVCDRAAVIEPSEPTGDACCPRCGHLLWWFRDRLTRDGGTDAALVDLDSSLVDDLGFDSLDAVELLMALEEEFDVTIPEEDVAKLRTIADVIRYVMDHRRGD